MLRCCAGICGAQKSEKSNGESNRRPKGESGVQHPAPGVTAEIAVWHNLQEGQEKAAEHPKTPSKSCTCGDAETDCPWFCRCKQKSKQEGQQAHTGDSEHSLARGQKVALASQPRPVSKVRRGKDSSCDVEDASVLERAEAYGKTFTDAFKWQVLNEEAGTINLQTSMGIARSLTPHRSGSGGPPTGSPGSSTRPRRAMTPGSAGRSERARLVSGESPRVGLSMQQTPQRLPNISRQQTPSSGSAYTLPPPPPYQAPLMLLALGDQYQLKTEVPRRAKASSEPPADGFVEIDGVEELANTQAADMPKSFSFMECGRGISAESSNGYFKVECANSGSEVQAAPEVPTPADSTGDDHPCAPAEANAAEPPQSRSVTPGAGDTESSNTRDVNDITPSAEASEASEEKPKTPARPRKSDECQGCPAGSLSLPVGDLDSAHQPMETPPQKLPGTSVRTPRSPPGFSPRGSPPRSPSTRSLSSSDSTLPLEFSDIDEPPTQAIASGAERASFGDTNEIPIELPKMGTRTCVTQYRYRDTKKELSLGLRGMNCLASNGTAVSVASVVQVPSQNGWIYQPDTLEQQLAPIQDTSSTPVVSSRPQERETTVRERKPILRSRVSTPRRRAPIPMSPREEAPAVVPNQAGTGSPVEVKVLTSEAGATEAVVHQIAEQRPRPERSSSGLSISSSEISLPPEFPEVQDGSLAGEHEVAAFSNTNEVPIELPKMGKRKCVTQWIKSNGQREVSLGLRAMSTLDSNSAMSGV